jgi:hypothetical protein
MNISYVTNARAVFCVTGNSDNILLWIFEVQVVFVSLWKHALVEDAHADLFREIGVDSSSLNPVCVSNKTAILVSLREPEFTSLSLSLDVFSKLFYFQWFFQPMQSPGLLFSSVIIFHRR